MGSTPDCILHLGSSDRSRTLDDSDVAGFVGFAKQFLEILESKLNYRENMNRMIMSVNRVHASTGEMIS